MGPLRALFRAYSPKLPSSYSREASSGIVQQCALREVSTRIGKWKLENGKAKLQNGNAKNKNAAAPANAVVGWRPSSGHGESVNYCLLGDSPVTMGKSWRWLQSSHEPSYIFAS